MQLHRQPPVLIRLAYHGANSPIQASVVLEAAHSNDGAVRERMLPHFQCRGMYAAFRLQVLSTLEKGAVWSV